jgi:hypothetical protein
MNVGFGEHTIRDSAMVFVEFWPTHFEDIKFYNMQRNAFYLVSSRATASPQINLIASTSYRKIRRQPPPARQFTLWAPAAC